MTKSNSDAEQYAENIATQLRKGFLSYCVLKVCAHEPRYTSDILRMLHAVDMVVVEGTIYPLLNRLQRDGMLEYEWVESEQGPPRKYYKTTHLGGEVVVEVAKKMKTLTNVLEKL